MFFLLLIGGIIIFAFTRDSEAEEKIESQVLERTSMSKDSVRLVVSFEGRQESTSRSRESNVFYAKETVVKIGGEDISLYLTYVGKSSNLPHVITLSSSLGTADKDLRVNMGYWPSYSAIMNNDRSTFLFWLKKGRRDPRADIGLVFIYFYGLEYRAIVENENHLDIYKELLALYEVYGEKSGSFSGYCTAFISWLILKNPQWNIQGDLVRTNIIKSTSALAQEVVWRFKEPSESYKLSGLAVDGEEFEIPRSLAVYSKEIISNFKKNIDAAGIDVDLAKNSEKRVYYKTASVISMDSHISLSYYRPSASVKRKLIELWDNTLEPFAAFNRVQKSDSVIAKLISPDQFGSGDNERIEKVLKEFLTFTNEKQCNIRALFEGLGAVEDATITLAESKVLAHLFEKNGVQVEPDPNITNKAFKFEEEIILFKYSGDPLRKDIWQKTVGLLDISASIAFADEESQSVEIQHTAKFIKEKFKLNQAEIKRLEMRSILLRKVKISASAIAKKMAMNISQKEASVLAKFLFSIASHDGVINNAEFKALERTFKAMEIPVLTLDSMLKEFTDSQNGKLVKLESVGRKKKTKGSKIPQQVESLPNEPVVLNEAALKTALAEAEEVSRILSVVFQEETAFENSVDSNKVPLNDLSPEVTHIGQKESAVISALSAKSRWQISEVENLCRQHKVMYGAFLNKVNDYYEAKTGSILMEEDGDELIISVELFGGEVNHA